MNHRYISLFITSYLTLSSFAFSQSNDSIVVTKEGSKPKTSYYVEAGTYGTKRETDPPAYVRNMSTLGIKENKDLKWLEVGLDYRLRGEYRKNDIRRAESISEDYPLLMKGRAYLGFKSIVGPLGFVFEFQDSHRNNGKYALDNRDVNRYEPIQNFVELNFKKALRNDKLGNNRPILLRGGRMCFEFLDRRLIGLNQWRNTTNNFLGLRGSIGQDKNDWQIDLLGLRPINRLINNYDEVNKDQVFYGAIGHWRRWSEIITIEPYYLALQQIPSTANLNRFREIHGIGNRIYGFIGKTGLNYEFTGMYQMGVDNGQKQEAYAVTGEVGYTLLSSKLKPRLSAFYGNVSGDKDPNDKVSNRFDRYFGFARPWSSDDYIIMENVVTPKIKLEFEPIKGLKIDGGYSYYWLESSTDRFNNLLESNAFNRDRTGKSGDFIGHGLDFRARYSPTKFIDLNVGYTHFNTGDFVKNRQLAATKKNASTSDFAYLEVNFNLFDLAKAYQTRLAKKTEKNNQKN